MGAQSESFGVSVNGGRYADGREFPGSGSRVHGLDRAPYPGAGLWYCDYYGSDYYCQDEGGNWLPSNPNWYNAAYAEMMRLYGQGIL